MSKCFSCKGMCCRYVTVDYPAPTTWEDFDEIRWYILHKGVIVYKVEDEDTWRIEFQTPCKHLDQETGLCKIYSHRPDVCKEYSTEECGWLDELSSEGCEVYIASDDDLKKYLLKHHPEFYPYVYPHGEIH